jgi:hypothetical protein
VILTTTSAACYRQQYSRRWIFPRINDVPADDPSVDAGDKVASLNTSNNKLVPEGQEGAKTIAEAIEVVKL